MFEKITKNIKGDKYIWVIVLILSLFSLLAVYSSTGTLAYKYRAGNTEYYLMKQVLIIGGGLVLMYLTHLINYKYFSRISQILYYLSIILLVLTLFFGTDINEAKRWITLPGVNLTFQTSDLAKFALIMYLARMLSKKQDMVRSFSEGFWPTIFPVFIICGLIAPEDLSSALVLFSTSVLVMFVGRIHIAYIVGLIGLSVITIGMFVTLLFTLPEESMPGRMTTWKARIESFMNTDGEEPYQLVQSKIAIAKGGFIPNGPGNSTQRNFLPHPYSDFIYAIIIEEYSFFGGVFVVFLYLAFLIRSGLIVRKAPKAFGALLSFGLALSLTIQAMINMGVAVGLLPVTGLTLPLVSMGGSSTIFVSLAFGIILSVSRDIEQLELGIDESEMSLEDLIMGSEEIEQE
ncbi:MAG: putative peptidoglycan glycosyltransferase FtsW [Chitinophagales bacterium]|tara:strand:- start:1907 stop:3115 length:1209 start_codon:yes stop_codon:yes gene_type:complete